MTVDIGKRSIALHKKFVGKMTTSITVDVKTKKDLSLVYTPGVAAVSSAIAEDDNQVWDLTMKAHCVAVISDGSSVLGLGNIGPHAALPVMEGKAILFKKFAGLTAFPICLDTQITREIIRSIKHIAPGFGGINLEDIAAPKCFEVEEKLQHLGIPVMHDDQHGTAIVILAGLINAAKVVKKDLKDLVVVISGAGAAGQAAAHLLRGKVKDQIILDSKGIIYKGRDGLDLYKKKLTRFTNQQNKVGGIKEALMGADVFIGVSKANLLTAADIKLMNSGAIVFAMANPTPEIMPDEAKKGGAAVVATGRSDFPNQINNVLAFPGIFKGAMSIRAPRITDEMKLASAYALASLIKRPTPNKIIPDPFDKRVVLAVSKACREAKINS